LEAKKAGPPQVGQGRKPAEPGARCASLDGPAAVRQRLSKRSWLGCLVSERASFDRVQREVRRTLILLQFSENRGCTTKRTSC